MTKLRFALPSTLVGLTLAGLAFFAAQPFLSDSLNFLPLWMLALGLVTFAYYGWDKAQSKRAGRRIPELTLHGLAVAGGVAGGWLGMVLFRHKTQKPIFRLVMLPAILLWAWLVWR